MKYKQKALIIISPGFAADEYDSTCLPSQQQLVCTLTEEDPSLQVIIIAFQYPFRAGTYHWKNAIVISLNGKNKGGLFRLLTWIKALRQLRILKNKYEVKGLFSFWYGECALIGKWFGRHNGLPHFTWLLGQDAKKGNVYAKLVRPVGNQIISISDSLADGFEKNYGTRPHHIIPPGIDTKRYAEKNDQKNIHVLGAGALIPLKQYDVFITVVEALQKKIPGIQSAICGEGPEKRQLANIIMQCGLQNTIRLEGLVSHTQVLEMMQQTKIFLHPSAYEGLGMVCLEALYAGAHVISFCKPFTQPISNWHIAKDAEEMIAMAAELLQDPKLNHDPVLPFTMQQTAKEILYLFDHSVAAIS